MYDLLHRQLMQRGLEFIQGFLGGKFYNFVLSSKAENFLKKLLKVLAVNITSDTSTKTKLKP